MEKRILTYRRFIDELLAGDREGTDWHKVREQHLIQVGFFQHERLIHLIVTVTFALLEMISIALFTICCNMDTATASVPALGALALVVLVLLIPYVRHYWILENEVQKMYEQYDAICVRCGQRDIYVRP
ncbi:MAG: hypothetical protein IJ833_06685 [Lachnospiraceae bacterium]|nr:hypothetical protein [Lachnospiraceae bacterium]